MTVRLLGPKRKAGVIFIFITITLDILAMGVIAPVLPKLVLNFLGGNTTDAAKMFGVFGTTFAVMQFFFSPVLGVLSDRFGRRPIILLSSLGLGLDYFIMALAPTLGWLLVGRIISGVTAASLATAMAYMTDVVEPEKRAGAFGMIGAAFGIGFVLGPALGGLLGNFDPRLPFWVAGALSLANTLYGFLLVPESLPKERRRPFKLSRANPVGSLVLLRSHPELWQLASIQFIGYVAHEVFNIWALYAIFRYAWKEGMIGLSLAAVGGVLSHHFRGPGPPHRGANRREKHPLARPAFWRAGYDPRRLGADQPGLLPFDPGHDAVVHLRAGGARPDDPPGERRRAR